MIHAHEFDFDAARERDIAEKRRAAGMARVEASALRRDPGFEDRALDAVRCFAESHTRFLAEDVRKACPTPEDIDGRVWGPVFTRARSKGWIAADGWEPANSSNRSAKVAWRSLIFRGAA